MATILVEILGNAKQLKAELASAQVSTAKANGGFAKMSKAAGVAGVAIAGGLAVGLVKSVEAADHMQQATVRMNQAFARSHVSAKAFSGRIEEAEKASRKLGFTNEEAAGSLGSLVVATHDGGKALKDLAIAEDIARFKHVSLETATKTLTMAMSGSQRAVKQLGISINKSTEATDAAKASYKKHLEALKEQFPATAKQTQAQHDLYLKMKNTLDMTYASDKAQAKLTDTHRTAARVIATVSDKLHGQADAYSKTAAGGMAQFHAQLEDVAEKLGKALLPALTSVATALATGAEFFSKHTTLAKGLVIALGALAAVLLTVSVATKLYAAGQAIWTAATTAYAGAQWLANAALDAFPVVAIVIGIAAVIAGLVLLYQNSQTFRDIVNGAFGEVKTVASDVFGFITDTLLPAFSSAFDTAKGIIKPIIDSIKGFFGGIETAFSGVVKLVKAVIDGDWSKAWDAAKQIISGLLTAIDNTLGGIPGKIIGLIKSLDIAGVAGKIGQAIIDGASRVLDGVGGLADKVGGFVSDIPGKLKDLLKDMLDAGAGVGGAIVDGITGAFKGLAGAVEGLVRSALNSAIGLLNSGFNAVHDNWPDIPGAPGPPFGHNPIPRLAKGGIVTSPTLAVIGERGPEAVIPLSGGGGGMGGITVNVYPQNLVSTKQELVEAVRNELIRMGRNTTGGALGRFA